MKTYQFMKRGADIIISLVMILGVLSWLTPIVALLIILDSKGSVFFIQSRDGLKGKGFDCIKFRTMRPNLAAHLIQAKNNDDRITFIGSFLRKSHIDELPQFFNILVGDMSFIGPRPHMHRDTAHYSKLIPNYMLRLDVKPGFTGLAQICDLCGNTSHLGDMKARVKMDILYVKNASLSLDLYICARSIAIAFRKIRSFFVINFTHFEEVAERQHGSIPSRLKRAA